MEEDGGFGVGTEPEVVEGRLSGGDDVPRQEVRRAENIPPWAAGNQCERDWGTGEGKRAG